METPIRHLPTREDFSFEETLAFYDAEKAYILSLVDHQIGNKGKRGFCVRKTGGNYSMVTPSASSNLYRVTNYDSEAFPLGHSEDPWETCVIEAMRGAEAFVPDIPLAPYEPGTKQELLQKIISGNEGRYTSLTLLLIHHVSHCELMKHRRALSSCTEAPALAKAS